MDIRSRYILLVKSLPYIPNIRPYIPKLLYAYS